LVKFTAKRTCTCGDEEEKHIECDAVGIPGYDDFTQELDLVYLTAHMDWPCKECRGTNGIITVTSLSPPPIVFVRCRGGNGPVSLGTTFRFGTGRYRINGAVSEIRRGDEVQKYTAYLRTSTGDWIHWNPMYGFQEGDAKTPLPRFYDPMKRGAKDAREGAAVLCCTRFAEVPSDMDSSELKKGKEKEDVETAKPASAEGDRIDIDSDVREASNPGVPTVPVVNTDKPNWGENTESDRMDVDDTTMNSINNSDPQIGTSEIPGANEARVRQQEHDGESPANTEELQSLDMAPFVGDGGAEEFPMRITIDATQSEILAEIDLVMGEGITEADFLISDGEGSASEDEDV
jgi:hypothetical protein